jgi:hypothetical protein
MAGEEGKREAAHHDYHHGNWITVMATATLGLPGSDLRMIPAGFAQITALSANGSGLPLSGVSTAGGSASCCIITCEGTGIRWRDDGVAPTAGVGYPLAAGDSLIYCGPLTAFQMIPQSGTPTVDIAFYRTP